MFDYLHKEKMWGGKFVKKKKKNGGGGGRGEGGGRGPLTYCIS